MNGQNANHYAALLRSGRWFAGLPEPLQADLVQLAMVKTLGAGEALFRRGDASCGLYAVVDGSVRILGISSAGKEVLLTLVEPPTWFGEISVIDGEPRTHDAISDSASTLIHLPQPALDTLLTASPLIWRELGRLVSTKIRLLFTTVEELAVLPVGARLARRLLLMAGAYGEWNDRSRRTVDVRQEQLAMMLSVSRQTVNALLKEFASQQLVRISYGQIELLDLEGLRRASTA